MGMTGAAVTVWCPFFLNASLLGRWVINSHDQGQFDLWVKIAWKKCTKLACVLVFKRHLTFCLQKVPCPNYNYIHVIIYPCVVLQVFFGITCHWCNHLKMSFPKEAAARAADEERAATEAAKAFAAEMMLGDDVEMWIWVWCFFVLFVWGARRCEDVDFLNVFLCCVCFFVIVICVLGGRHDYE